MPKYVPLKPSIMHLFIITIIINIMVYLTCKYGICSRFQPLNKYPYSIEKMQTNMYRDQIVLGKYTYLSTNKPQIFRVIFITNCVLRHANMVFVQDLNPLTNTLTALPVDIYNISCTASSHFNQADMPKYLPLKLYIL